MALYDMLGNFTGNYGADTYDEEQKRREEEERKRREELANTEVQTQKTTTYGDGSKTHTTTTEIPASAQPQARAMPIPTQVSGPVSPDSFQRIRQMESGNRDYTPQGTPVTSPSGAMFASQVMPSTAQQPGFGVRPAQSQTPEEYNRVGQDYFNAMKQRYGNNEELAAAAYHSGPGNVDKALQQAQSTGQDWRTFLGPQGQQYVQKFSGGKLSMAPQQAIQPQPQAQPTQQPQPEVSQYNIAGTTGGQGLQMPQQQPQPTMGVESAQQQFQTNQDNLDELLKMRSDQNVPEYLRNRASNRAYELMNQNVKMDAANNQIKNMVESGDTQGISKILTSKPKDEQGSWLKFALYGFISPQLAQAEAVKLGIAPTKWEDGAIQGPNGEQIGVQLQRRVDGKIIGGTRADGTPLTSKEIESAQSGLGKHVSTTAETYIDQAGNRYRSQTDEKGNARMVNIATGQRFTGDASKLQRQTDVSSMARVDYGLATDLLKKHSGNVLDMMKEYETIKGPMDQAARQEFMSRYGYGTTVQPPQKPGGQAIPTAQAAPTTGAVAPTTQPASTAPAIPAVGPVAPTAQPASTQSIAGMKKGMEIETKRTESLNKILDEEVRPQAQAGDTVVQVRKQQFQIFDRPGVDANKLFGLYNAAQEGTGAQGASIIRDILGGTFKPETEVSQRLAQLNLTPQEKSALMEYNIANQRINAATLKQSAGPGSVSDAEQKANRESNVDPTKIPALGAYNAMAQSQFNGDLARYKADWATKQSAGNALELDKAWRKESQQLSQMYGDIAKKRAEFISSNGATTNAVKEGYRRYPIPEYDPQTETWKKTKPLADIFGR